MPPSRRFSTIVSLSLALAPSVAVAQAPPPSAVPDDADADEVVPDATHGVVSGVVTDGAGKETLADVQVVVVGTNARATTDVDGKFALRLAPGTYALRVFYPGFHARRVDQLRVTAKTVARVDVALTRDKRAAAVEEVVVEVEPDRSTAATQLLLRRKSAASSDAIGAAEIARSPDRNAADASRRIVGASVVDGRYVFVRGLGDRYSASTLDGVPLPSTEPDRQAVPLDLFPALVLSDVSIAKTFTPDMPGNFAGGLVRISTRQMPTKPTWQLSASLAYNTQSTLRERPSYRGGGRDWLGLDDGTRALPDSAAGGKVSRVFPDGTDNPAITQQGRDMNAYMSTTRATSLPNGSLSVVGGDSWALGGGRTLGALAALTYGRRYVRRAHEVLRTYAPDPAAPGRLLTLNDYTAETGQDLVSWGGLGAATLTFSRDHRVTLTTLFSVSSENEAREISGYNEERVASLSDTRLRFVSRQLAYAQLRGEHRVGGESGLGVGWTLHASRATSDEPDTRQNVYVDDSTTGPAWTESTLSGSHFFAKQRERAVGGGVDLTQPLGTADVPVTMKTGASVSLKHRTFDARRFRFTAARGIDPSVFNQPPDALFTDANIGRALELIEYTRPNDSYEADQNLYAGYLMADVSPHRRVRAILGERVEVSRQVLSSFDPFDPALNPVEASLKTTDLLPSATLVLEATSRSNVRLSATRTIARPQLRELAPFVFTDYFGAREVQGNPTLDRTRITNFDARYEVFPSGSEVLAASLFYKRFQKPIETVVIPTNKGVVSFQNAEGATALGVELEARKSLGFASPALRDLSVLGNFTWVRSRVSLDSSQQGVQTNPERPMAGQSPYVVNAALDYTNDTRGTRARLLFNVFGPRISQVGSFGLPDVYERPRPTLDATLGQRIGKKVDVRLSAENITNAKVRFGHGTTGDSIVNEFALGTTVMAGVTVGE